MPVVNMVGGFCWGSIGMRVFVYEFAPRLNIYGECCNLWTVSAREK